MWLSYTCIYVDCRLCLIPHLSVQHYVRKCEHFPRHIVHPKLVRVDRVGRNGVGDIVSVRVRGIDIVDLKG